MYNVTLKIGDSYFNSVSDSTIHDLYTAARSLVRFGVRHKTRIDCTVRCVGKWQNVFRVTAQPLAGGWYGVHDEHCLIARDGGKEM